MCGVCVALEAAVTLTMKPFYIYILYTWVYFANFAIDLNRVNIRGINCTLDSEIGLGTHVLFVLACRVLVYVESI